MSDGGDGISYEQNSERGNFIATHSGAYFYIDECNLEDIPIEDIANALALSCRFNGHIDRFYSVAEHSVIVSHLVPEEWALCGLLHDASEAFVADMPRPFKSAIKGYNEVQARIEKAVAEHYGFPFPLPEAVEYIDRHIVADEANVLFKQPPEWTHFYDSVCPHEMIAGLDPDAAKELFLDRYKELTQ